MLFTESPLISVFRSPLEIQVQVIVVARFRMHCSWLKFSHPMMQSTSLQRCGLGKPGEFFGDLMWLKQCHKLPLTGMVYTVYTTNHTTYLWWSGGWFIVVLTTLLLMFFSWKNWTLGLSHGQVVYDPQILVIILSMWQTQTAAENWVITISTGIYFSCFFWDHYNIYSRCFSRLVENQWFPVRKMIRWHPQLKKKTCFNPIKVTVKSQRNPIKIPLRSYYHMKSH